MKIVEKSALNYRPGQQYQFVVVRRSRGAIIRTTSPRLISTGPSQSSCRAIRRVRRFADAEPSTSPRDAIEPILQDYADQVPSALPGEIHERVTALVPRLCEEIRIPACSNSATSWKHSSGQKCFNRRV